MTFSDQFIEIFNFLAGQIGIMIDWTSENVIPYLTNFCERYVKYEIATSIAWIVIMLVLLLIVFIILRIAIKDYKTNDCSEGIALFFMWIVFIVVFIVTFVVIANQAFDIIKVLTIPEQTMIERMFEIKRQLGH